MFKKKISAEEQQNIADKARKESFQEFLPVKDIYNSCVVDENNEVYPVLEIESRNIELNSLSDNIKLAKSAEIILSSIDIPYQICAILMPVNTEEWKNSKMRIIKEIAQKRMDLDQSTPEGQVMDAQLEVRSNLLSDAIQFVDTQAQGGYMSTHKTFMIPKLNHVTDTHVAVDKAKEYCKLFSSAGINVELAKDAEIRIMLYMLCNPLTSHINSVPITSPASVLISTNED